MIAPETSQLLAILMDTPGLKQEQIGPLLKNLLQVVGQSHGCYFDGKTFADVVDDMVEAWTG